VIQRVHQRRLDGHAAVGGGRFGRLEEQPVRDPHDVGLVGDGDVLVVVASGVP
jgi:hypothetical protein